MKTSLLPARPAPGSEPARPRLVVFADDWGRHPSSCQHLLRQLLDEMDVTWVNTIGTRSPMLDWGTFARGMGKVRQWMRGEQTSPAAPVCPRVLSPPMWPGFRRPWQRRLNQRLIGRCLEKHVPRLAETVLLTTLPIVADLLDSLPFQRSVYYCVDDFSAWPGLDSRPLGEMERMLVGKVDAIVAAGENLRERIGQMGRSDVQLLTHGLDLAHWSRRCAPDSLLADCERPVALFWGLIDRRLDVNWLEALGRSMTSGTIVLVGPEQNPDGRLAHVPRLCRLGPVSYERLPGVAAGSDVLIMPYADLPVTRAMQPLKLKEYLATGKPVVARRLPAVEDWVDCLDAAESPEAFCAACHQRGQQPLDATQQLARKRLAQESWSGKAAELRAILLGEMSPQVRKSPNPWMAP